MTITNKPGRWASRSALGLAVLAALAIGPGGAFAQGDAPRRAADPSVRIDKLDVIGLTADQRLVSFAAKNPGKENVLGRISGLQAPDTALVGIDFRVQDDLLYGVGNGGGIYTIDAATGASTPVSRLTVALTGASFGVDFNPAANALRIVSDSGQNLRHPFAGATAGQTQTDMPLNYAGTAAMGITGSAYVNNDADASTGTTLFAIDANLDQVALQSPPNAGTLVATGKITVDAGSDVGFDIFTSISGAATTGNVAFASLVVGGQPGLYDVNLLTGKATLLGALASPLVGLAIPLDQ